MARGTTYGTIDGPDGPSMAAILGPGDHLWQEKLLQMVQGDQFLGDIGSMTDPSKKKLLTFHINKKKGKLCHGQSWG